MKTTAKKHCRRCCPEGETWTNIHDRGHSDHGFPVWRCRCCGSEQPRRVRTPKPDPEVDALFEQLMREVSA